MASWGAVFAYSQEITTYIHAALESNKEQGLRFLQYRERSGPETLSQVDRPIDLGACQEVGYSSPTHRSAYSPMYGSRYRAKPPELASRYATNLLRSPIISFHHTLKGVGTSPEKKTHAIPHALPTSASVNNVCKKPQNPTSAANSRSKSRGVVRSALWYAAAHTFISSTDHRD